MADRNGKVTTRHVRPAKTSLSAKLLPKPTVPDVYDYELDDVHWDLKHKNAGIHGATVTVDGFFKARNLDALKALQKLGAGPQETTEVGQAIVAIQTMGKSAEGTLTTEFYAAHKETKWAFLRASRIAGVEFPGGANPPGWDQVRDILYEDISREKTMRYLIKELGIIGINELRSETLRLENHPSALTDGVL